MSPLVLVLVLLAALLHAGWNALIKINEDRLVVMAILAGSSSLIALCLVPFVAVPIAAAWPFLIASLIIHLGYMIFLVLAYMHADYGQVYPIARGTAPMLAAIAGTFILGEVLSTTQWVAIALITGGIVSLAVHGLGSVTHNLKGIGIALITACFIATYTIIDAIGARVSGDVHSFAIWLLFLDGLMFSMVAAVRRRGALWASVARNWRIGIFAGFISAAAYWIVLWAFTVSTVAPVAALRETSVVFAAVIAAHFLKEGKGWQRFAAPIVVVFGVYLLATAG